jgi:hypothetical protein
MDIAEVRTGEGHLYPFVAFDRTSQLAFGQLHENATGRIAADFLHARVAAVPYRIQRVLTGNGTQFLDCTRTNEEAVTAAAEPSQDEVPAPPTLPPTTTHSQVREP